MAEVTVRKAELDAVVSVLESDEYEDARGVARAVVKALYGAWRQREWWVVRYAPTGDSRFTLLYGLEPTEGAARKAAGLLSGGTARLVKVFPVSLLEERSAEIEVEAMVRSDSPCAECGHHKWEHGAVGYMGQSVKTPAGKACSLKCKCKAYRAPEPEEREGVDVVFEDGDGHLSVVQRDERAA